MLKFNCSSFDKFEEKLYSTTDLVENIQKIVKIRNDLSTDNIQSGSNTSNLTRSESKSSYTEKNDEAVVDVLLVTPEKLNSNIRRRYENQVNLLFLLYCHYWNKIGSVTIGWIVQKTVRAHNRNCSKFRSRSCQMFSFVFGIQFRKRFYQVCTVLRWKVSFSSGGFFSILKFCVCQVSKAKTATERNMRRNLAIAHQKNESYSGFV